ncbi:hypothetical protein [Clostridium psychrophilum]|uniref:hypothetical protein n=1 Tax=Clostridium psychrophilum TaxID=132926 RepID=UPI001C0C557F|nr:hypothetical protein [Clostridium psychrophilum]MBU3182444.1 hypothetical protein [Clostridium psychrophilum]
MEVCITIQDFKEFMYLLKINNLDTNKLLDYIQMSLEKKNSMSFDTYINFKNGLIYFNIEVTPMC